MTSRSGTPVRRILVKLRVCRQFVELCERIGRPDLASRPEFLTNELRVKNRALLLPELSEIIRQRSSAQWSQEFRGVSFPYGPVNNMAEVFADPQVQHSQLAQYVEHPTVGRVGLVAPAVTFSSSQNQVRGPPPTLGQHTDTVLQVRLLRPWVDILTNPWGGGKDKEIWEE